MSSLRVKAAAKFGDRGLWLVKKLIHSHSVDSNCCIPANSPSLGRSIRHFRLAKILRPRRRKSPSFEHRLFFVFGPSFRIFQV